MASDTCIEIINNNKQNIGTVIRIKNNKKFGSYIRASFNSHSVVVII